MIDLSDKQTWFDQQKDIDVDNDYPKFYRLFFNKIGFFVG